MCLVYIYSNLKGYYEMYVKLESTNIWVGGLYELNSVCLPIAWKCLLSTLEPEMCDLLVFKVCFQMQLVPLLLGLHVLLFVPGVFRFLPSALRVQVR
jgi:hypothetical protein